MRQRKLLCHTHVEHVFVEIRHAAQGAARDRNSHTLQSQITDAESETRAWLDRAERPKAVIFARPCPGYAEVSRRARPPAPCTWLSHAPPAACRSLSGGLSFLNRKRAVTPITSPPESVPPSPPAEPASSDGAGPLVPAPSRVPSALSRRPSCTKPDSAGSAATPPPMTSPQKSSMRQGVPRYAAGSARAVRALDGDPAATGTPDKHVRFLGVPGDRIKRRTTRDVKRAIRKGEVREMQRALADVHRDDSDSDEEEDRRFRKSAGFSSPPPRDRY